SPAGVAVVNAQAGLPLDGQARQPLRVGLAERALRALEDPPRPAAAACEEPLAPGFGADQLGHRRGRAAQRTEAAKPALVELAVAPAREGGRDGREVTRRGGPAEEAEQSWGGGVERVVVEKPLRDAPRRLGL